MYRFIYLFGPDGTGKTTHANLIADRLRRMGYKAWRASIKQHHTIAYLLLKLVRAGDPRISYYGFNDKLKHKIRRVWKTVELFGLLPAIIYRVLFPLSLGYIVVCDRYVLDTLVVLSYFLGDQNLPSSTCARILVRLIPKNSLLIHLDADAKVILLRKRDEPLNIHIIEYYRKMYEIIVKLLDLKVVRIETTLTPIKDVQRKILNLIANGFA